VTVPCIPHPRTAAALQARRQAAAEALERVQEAINRLRRDKTPITVAAVARRAHVSRTFCYDNTEARAAIAAAIQESGQRRTQILADTDEQREATWRERALNAEDALKAAHAEILAHRAQIGELLGRVRDLEAEWTQDAIQRITSENTTLKQRVRQLTADNRALEERLQAARSNLRHTDRRVADLEAQIADPIAKDRLRLVSPSPPASDRR
jgi:chromosome segregation ATPase